MEDTEKASIRPDYDLDKTLGSTVECINVGGHKQELDENFSLLSIIAVGTVNGNAWAYLGGSIVCLSLGIDLTERNVLTSCYQTVAISNGGPPGVIYELYWPPSI